MDIFVFEPVLNEIKLQGGKIVNNILSTTWIERYRDTGEFTITATLASNIREQLPLGSLISHINSHEVMIVENHEVSDERGQDVEITITGRSFESFLENRIVGANTTFPANIDPENPNYILAADQTWNQAVTLINAHIGASVTNPSDKLDKVTVRAVINQTAPDATPEARSIPIGNLYDAVIDILGIDNLGIRIFRQWYTGEDGLYIEIHDGSNQTTNVIFSFDAGDITNVDYLWTEKNDKNAVMVVSKWYKLFLSKGSNSGYSKRVDVLDASDIDEGYNEQPAPGSQTETILRSAINARGLQYLAIKNPISLAKAQTAKNAKRFMYRRNFNLGDIVTIDGQFEHIAKMRIIEHVEVYDQSGFSSYPTLSTVF